MRDRESIYKWELGRERVYETDRQGKEKVREIRTRVCARVFLLIAWIVAKIK